MADTISPASMMAFTQGPEDFHPPQATVSLSETSLENGPVPATPESIYIKDEEDQENQEERKPTKKRKSWGQELPTPKTNLPPRYVLRNYHPVLPRVLTMTLASERRQKTRRSNVASNAFFATVKQPSPLASVSDKRLKSSRVRNQPLSGRTSRSRSD